MDSLQGLDASLFLPGGRKSEGLEKYMGFAHYFSVTYS